MVPCPRSVLSRETIQHTFSELCPLYRLLSLYQAPDSRALAPACGALILYLAAFECNAASDLLNHTDWLV